MARTVTLDWLIWLKQTFQKSTSSKKNGLEESAHAAFSGKKHCTRARGYKQHLQLSSPRVGRGPRLPATPGATRGRPERSRMPEFEADTDWETPWDFWPASAF